MHYGRYDFSKHYGVLPTLNATAGNESGNQQMGNRAYLPAVDAAEMVKRYGPP
jgi:hypothetical protein